MYENEYIQVYPFDVCKWGHPMYSSEATQLMYANDVNVCTHSSKDN